MNFKFDYRSAVIVSITVKSFLMMFISINLNIEQKFKKYIPVLLIISSISPVIKCLKWIFENGVDNHQRIGTLWSHPNYVGLFLGVILLMSLIKAFNTDKIFSKILYSSYGILLFFIINVATKSRNAILSVLISIFIFLFFKKKEIDKKKLMIGGGLGIISIIYFLKKYNMSVFSRFSIEVLRNDGRIQIYETALKTLGKKENLWYGQGFYYHHRYILDTGREQLLFYHNDFLEILINQGIIGFTFYLIFFLYLLKIMVNIYQKKEFENFDILSIGIVLWIYFMISGIFDNMIYANRIMEISYLFIGLSIGEININASENKNKKKI